MMIGNKQRAIEMYASAQDVFFKLTDKTDLTTCTPGGGEGALGRLLPEKIGGGVRPASQSPLPYLSPKSVLFPTLFISGHKTRNFFYPVCHTCIFWYVHVSPNVYMLFTGREVRIGKNYARGFEYGARLRPRAVPKTEGTVFPNTDRPRPANNVFIIFFRRVLCKQFLC